MKGLRVFATARSIKKIDALATKGIELLELDVTNPESISAAKADVAKRTGGKLDILVNNASVSLRYPAAAVDEALTDSVY